jgi:hypothetical protein
MVTPIRAPAVSPPAEGATSAVFVLDPHAVTVIAIATAAAATGRCRNFIVSPRVVAGRQGRHSIRRAADHAAVEWCESHRSASVSDNIDDVNASF